MEEGLGSDQKSMLDRPLELAVLPHGLRRYRRLLGRGVISAETARRLESLSGFRNILVHEYAGIDLGRVVLGLSRLDDVESFVADVADWLARSGR